MKKLSMIIVLALSLIPFQAFAAKAAVLVTSIGSDGVSGFVFDYYVVTDTGLAIGSGGTPINLTSSIPTIVSAIKAAARQTLIEGYDVDIAPNDMTVFCGPQ